MYGISVDEGASTVRLLWLICNEYKEKKIG